MKKYINYAFIYTVLAMVCGVFYREYTKFLHFEGQTTLAVLHTHYFTVGMVLCLIFAILEQLTAFSAQKPGKLFQVCYHIGLNITTVMLFLRGIVQVHSIALSQVADAAISGMAGLGHILLAIGLFSFFIALNRGIVVVAQKQEIT